MKELIEIQRELKAPKGQRNNFGNYNYRSCEDILEAVKPLCHKNKCVLTISDEIVEVGGRIYVKALACLTAIDSLQPIASSTAYARESESKKGMDASQITGSASSYARKYALNGLFCIDDTKDADTMDNRSVAQDKPAKPKMADSGQRKTLEAYMKRFTQTNNVKAIDYISEALANPELTEEEAQKIISHSKTSLGE